MKKENTCILQSRPVDLDTRSHYSPLFRIILFSLSHTSTGYTSAYMLSHFFEQGKTVVREKDGFLLGKQWVTVAQKSPSLTPH